jgi:hypothetical protein
MTTLAGNLPTDENHNGIPAIQDELIKDPGKRQVVVAYIDAVKLTTKTDDGTTEPTLRIRRVEVAVTEKHQQALVQIMDEITQDRMGMLPFDGEDDDPDAT